MDLILEISSPQPDVDTRRTFHEDGGSIGRDVSNTWVLPHSKVSGLHAVISYRDGEFYIEDRSRNGVCLNSSRNRLEARRPYTLTSGDRILIEPYEIRVVITQRAEDRRGLVQDPFSANDPFAPLPINAPGPSIDENDLPRQALDPMELLNLKAPDRARAPKARTGQDLQGGSLLDDAVKVPVAMPDPARPAVVPPVNIPSIPADYDPLAPDDVFAVPPAPQRTPEPRMIPARPREAPAPAAVPRESAPPVAPAVPAPRPAIVFSDPPLPVAAREFELPAVSAPPSVPAPDAATGSARAAADFAAVLKGAGVDPADVTPEVAEEFGAILRVVVAGVMDVMRSRQQIKEEFRMQVTRVQPIENNPLKFSADVDDALHNLLLKRNRAYLSPVDAFADAFADLRHHQIAMLAGMRVAFEAMLDEFDPDSLQKEFDRQLNKGLIPAKLRYWDLYRDRCHEMVKDPDTSFRRLFGEAFARVYEDQLRELKARERDAGAGARKPKPSDT